MVTKWGLGIEKEFPINIGPYKTPHVKKAYDASLSCIKDAMFHLYDQPNVNLEVKQFKHILTQAMSIIDNPETDFDNFKEVYVNFKSSNMTFHNKNIINNISDSIYIEDEEDIEIQKERVVNDHTSDSMKQYAQTLIDKYEHKKEQTLMLLTMYGDFNQALCACITKQNSMLNFLEKYICLNLCYDLQLYMYFHFFKDALPLKNGTDNLFGIQHKLFTTWPSKPILNEIGIMNEVTKENMVEYTRNYANMDTDPGGFEVRTDNFKNATAENCTKELAQKISVVYSKLSTICLSQNDIDNNIGIYFEDRFASYYKPILHLLSITKSKMKKIEIKLDQIYSGDSEINITLPYIEWEELQKLQQYLNSNSTNISYKKIIESFLSKKITNFDDSSIKTQVSEKLAMFYSTIPKTFSNYMQLFDKLHIDTMKSLRLLSPLFLAVLTGVNYLSFGDNATIPETSKRFMSYSGYRIFTTQLLDTLYKPYVNVEDYNIETHSIFKNIMKEYDLNYQNNPHMMEFSVNRKQIKYNPTENPKTRKMFGFEWKVLDQYPVEYVPNVLLFIVLLAQWVHNRPLTLPNIEEFIAYFHPVSFEDFIETIVFQGWNTETNTRFSHYICQLFKFDFLYSKIVNIPFEDSYTCADFLQDIFDQLYTSFTNTNEPTHIIECFYPNFNSGKYKKYSTLPSVNYANYCNMIQDMKKYHSSMYYKAESEISSLEENEDFQDLMLCNSFRSHNNGFDLHT